MSHKNIFLALVLALAGWGVDAQAGWFGLGKKPKAPSAEAPASDNQLPPSDAGDQPAPGVDQKKPAAVGAGKSAAQPSSFGADALSSDQPSAAPDASKQDNKPKDEAGKAGTGGLPTEIVIKGQDTNKLEGSKPPLQIEVDPYESIRNSLKPDETMLLAVSPLTVSWRRTHPEFLYAGRIIEPWRTTFSPKPGIVFRPRDQLFEVFQRKMDPKEAKVYSWSLTIADEEGRVFQHYEGSSDPPEELLWSGQNDQGEWIHAGRSYSAVYTFTDPGGSPHTGVAKPLLFKGIVHQEDSGLQISLDSAVLFGSSKTGSDFADQTGADLLRSAADLVKRRFTGIPISLRVFASTKELGESQGISIMNYLMRELMLSTQNISVAAARAPYSEQRVEIVLLNR